MFESSGHFLLPCKKPCLHWPCSKIWSRPFFHWATIRPIDLGNFNMQFPWTATMNGLVIDVLDVAFKCVFDIRIWSKFEFIASEIRAFNQPSIEQKTVVQCKGECVQVLFVWIPSITLEWVQWWKSPQKRHTSDQGLFCLATMQAPKHKRKKGIGFENLFQPNESGVELQKYSRNMLLLLLLLSAIKVP